MVRCGRRLLEPATLRSSRPMKNESRCTSTNESREHCLQGYSSSSSQSLGISSTTPWQRGMSRPRSSFSSTIKHSTGTSPAPWGTSRTPGLTGKRRQAEVGFDDSKMLIGPPRCRGLFRRVTTPVILCHKELPRASKAPY